MLSARGAAVSYTRTAHFLSHSPLHHHSRSQSVLLRHLRLCSASANRSQPSIKMSSSTSTNNQVIEHIVLFKVKPETDPSKVNDMVNNLSSLTSLPQVLHLSSGPIVRTRSSSPLTFTHILHSRYATKDDLAEYSAHPAHVSVVTNYVRPIAEDVMAVDWVNDSPLVIAHPTPGSAMRVSFLKLKEGVGESEKFKILEVVKGIKEKFGHLVEELSSGENFSPGRAKGFSIGSIALFKGMKELDALDLETEAANEEKDKVRELLDSVLVLDYVVPSALQQSASL